MNKNLATIIIPVMCIIAGITFGYYLKPEKELSNDNQDNINVETDNNSNNNFDNVDGEEKNNSTENDYNNEEQNNNTLTDEQKNYINAFINEKSNYAFTQISYTNPKNILNNNNSTNIGDIVSKCNANKLLYSIDISTSNSYARKATKEELNIIRNGGEIYVDSRITTYDNIKNYLKQRTNYDYEKSLIIEAFSDNYNYKINKYVINITDSIFDETLHVESGYKKDNYIYVTLNNGTELTLIDNTNAQEKLYYFYACKVNTKFKLCD